MSHSGQVVRPEQPDDVAEIGDLLEAAFGRPHEARLVAELGRDGALELSLVAERNGGGVIGYAAFPRLSVITDGALVPAAGLAPLAVVADMRRRGVGAALIRSGMAVLRQHGVPLLFVLGDPGYYRRFGFEAARGAQFTSPYSGPHFLAAALASAVPCAGTVRYPAAFLALG
jgi:putative acetyltransferase